MAGETPGRGKRRSRSSAVVQWTENLSETQYAYLLLTPVFVLLGVIAFWPLLSTFEMSLHADAFVGQQDLGEIVGFENYVALLTGERNALLTRPLVPPSPTLEAFLTSALSVTVVFTVVSVFFETIIGFGQALVLDQEFTGRRWVRVAIILPWAVPIVIQGMIFFLLFQPGIGFLTGTAENPGFLNEIGLLSTTPLSNSQDSLLIVIVADIWKTSAFMALLILAGLQSIDRSLYDVAEVSGASLWQRFRYVTFPLVLPTVLVAMLFRTIAAMRVFGVIETVTSCSNVPSLSCLVVSTFSNRMYGTSAAVAFLTAVIIGVLVSIYIYYYELSGGTGG